MLYLDNASTTKVHPEVINKMVPFLNEIYGNPNSRYYDQAKKAFQAVKEARDLVSKLVGCKENEIIFTSGSAESNNMILKGLFFSDVKKKKIISTKIEHSSILATLDFLEKFGAEIVYIPIQKNGEIDIDFLRNELDERTLLVSVMYVNNELGNIQNIKKIASLCYERNVFFHSDVTQAIGKAVLDVSSIIGLSSVSFSAHKFYGPKGIGGIYLSKELKKMISPLIHGGEQEDSLRGGTLAVHQIVGMGEAARICKQDLEKNMKILKENETKLIKKLDLLFGEKIIYNNLQMNKVPGLINFQIKNINNEVFLKKVSDEIAASTGSACSSSYPSHVLKEIGLTEIEVRSSIRFSLSAYDDYFDFNAFL